MTNNRSQGFLFRAISGLDTRKDFDSGQWWDSEITFISLCQNHIDMAKLIEVVKQVSEAHNADVFIFTGRIIDDNADTLINEIRAVKQRKKNCVLVLTTMGGDP